VTFKLKSAAAAAAGVFNIYSVQHRWLAEIGVVEPAADDFAYVDLLSPTVRIASGSSNTAWEVRPDRLIVWSETAKEDCGKQLGRALEYLPWTPLIGVGASIEFHADLSIADKLPNQFPIGPKPEGFSVGTRSWHYNLEEKARRFIFQMTLNPESQESPGSVVLSINVHTDIAKDAKQLDANRMAIAACGNYHSNIDEAVALARKLLEEKVKLCL